MDVASAKHHNIAGSRVLSGEREGNLCDEIGDGVKDILASALQKLEKLFLDAGVIFLDADASGGAGMRLPPEKAFRSGDLVGAQKN